jgi:hypothetical protein
MLVVDTVDYLGQSKPKHHKIANFYPDHLEAITNAPYLSIA